MECLKGHHSYYMSGGMTHHELCKMDTNMTSSEANDYEGRHSNQLPSRRPSDLGSVSEIGQQQAVRVNPGLANGIFFPELAHLQCTCDHNSNGKATVNGFLIEPGNLKFKIIIIIKFLFPVIIYVIAKISYT